MKIVLVNRFFHPDIAPTARLATDVAMDLSKTGYEVHAVTSRLGYEAPERELAAAEAISGVHVHRVWTTSFGRHVLLGRVSDYVSFYASVLARLLLLLKPGDLAVAKTDPPLISVVVAVAAMARGARLVNWQQDVFPETAAELGFPVLAGPVGWPLRALRRWSLRVAAGNVVLGERMAARVTGIVGAGHKAVAIPNWADGKAVFPIAPSESVLRRQWGLGDKFVVGYSGNMGRAHDMETIIDACVRLKDDPGIAFVFTGGGNKRSLLESAVEKHRLRNVRLGPYVEDARLGDSLAACDVHLASLLPALEGLIVPSKFYGIAAAGRPTLFVGDPDGEVPRLLSRHGIGATVRSGDADGLVNAILSLSRDEPARLAMGARARTVFEAEWDKPIALERWRRLVSEIAGASR